MSGVSFRIAGKEILRGVSLDVDVARLGVVGRNGSGKSTLARLVAGLVAPSEGRVRVNGKELAADRRAALSEVGILFQNPDHQIIFPSVLEEVAFGLGQQGMGRREAEAEAREVLARFGKAHWEEAAVAGLSQGQKHLVCLMAVVAMEPKLLILDEPYAGLDIPTRRQLMRYLGRYEGALLHISHDPEDLAGYDHVIWLEMGGVAREGAAEAVLAAYRDEMERLGARDDISDLAG
ncbi:MAG: ABC transporter ATP-binding protein [Roseovarius sp.]